MHGNNKILSFHSCKILHRKKGSDQIIPVKENLGRRRVKGAVTDSNLKPSKAALKTVVYFVLLVEFKHQPFLQNR